MKYLYLIGFYILCFCQQISDGLLPFWIIWNVGQGQWVSYINESRCYHFDVGGEFFDKARLQKHCTDKINVLSFSHWDWDHIGFARRLKRATLKSCVLYMPNGPSNQYKKQFLSAFPSCGKISQTFFSVYSPRGAIKASNNWSRVFFSSFVIIPGDGTKKTDQKWLPFVKGKPQYLILAHHGSKTGTSKELLETLKKGGTAISSARKKKYGHPHPYIQKLLKKTGINLLSTEEFGHIHFQQQNKLTP